MSQNLPASLHLKVVGPTKKAVDENVKEVHLPGLDGYLGILPGHRPLMVSLGKGTISYGKGSAMQKLSIEGGMAEILPEKVLVFARFSEHEA